MASEVEEEMCKNESNAFGDWRSFVVCTHFFIWFRFVLLVNMFAQLNDPQSHTHDPTKPTYTHSYTPTTSNHPGINFCATNYCQKLGNKSKEEKKEERRRRRRKH
jgi:hypothetical protein